MFSLTIKGLWAHKLRYALTGLAVVLGVAFMAGTMVLTDTMGKTFDGVFASANDGTDVIVRRDHRRRPTTATCGTASTPASSTRSLPSTASTPPAARSRASPSSSRPTARRGHRRPRRDGRRQLDRRRAAQPVRAASRPRARRADEAVIDEDTAEDQGWALGDRSAC